MKMTGIPEDEIEKQINDLNAAIFEYKQMISQQSIVDYKINNILPAVEKIINNTLCKDLSSALSVKIGELCFNSGLFENAKCFFGKALASDPGNSDALNNLGVISLRNKDVETARHLITKAIEINPDHIEAKRNLNVIHETFNAAIKEGIINPDKSIELRDMKTYWNMCAADNAMRHIAVDHWENEDVFHGSGEKDIDKILSFLDEDLLKNVHYRVLEVGCGIGRLLKPFALRYPNLDFYGVDVSSEMIRKGELRLLDLPNVNVYSSNGQDLKMFEDNFFHLVYSYIVLQHIPRKFVQNYISEISRTLVDKGLFIFQLPVRQSDAKLTEPPDTDFRTVRYYYEKEVDLLCKSNQLEIVNTIPTGEWKNSQSAWFITIKTITRKDLIPPVAT
jgi:SAM-dependent methyltransferase